MKKLRDVFKENKPIIGMIHLNGRNDKEIRELAKKEIDILIDNGVDAVLVENYFGNTYNVEETLEYLYSHRRDINYGLNVLPKSQDPFEAIKIAFALAKKYQAKFIQLDSISGHLPVKEDRVFESLIYRQRQNSNVLVFGGVRFKYQRHVPGRSLEEDLEYAKNRADVIVTTGDGTGMETPLDKLKEFKRILNSFPLASGAGVNINNCVEQLNVVDTAIVGSYFKETHQDFGDVSPVHTKALMGKVKELRKRLN